MASQQRRNPLVSPSRGVLPSSSTGPTATTTTTTDLPALLRPSERVTAAVPCRIRVDSAEYVRAEVSVVCHSDEAAIFVLLPPSPASDPRLTHLIPITPSFKHWLNQTPPSPSTSFFHQSSRPHITLTLSHPTAKADLRISSSSSHTQKVQAFITELRRLVEASKTIRKSPAVAHSWLGYYPLERPRGLIDSDDDDDGQVTPSAGPSSAGMLSPSESSSSITTLQTPLSSLTLGTDSQAQADDNEYPNPFAPGFSRVRFIKKRLFARQAGWSERSSIKIRLVTYNVNDKIPPSGTDELRGVVGQGEEDILVIGLQEVDLRGQALLISQGNSRADAWEGAILKGLGEEAPEFEKVALSQYVGVVTFVFVKRAIRDKIGRIETSERGIGLLGFGGNKAGVAVRMKVCDTTLTFVNSHLAAFATALDRRRQDYLTLLKTLTFPQLLEADSHPALEELSPESPEKLLGVEDSHLLFWMGDLNYRIEMPDDVLRAWVEEAKYSNILEKDQLKGDIASGKSFAGFKEPEIGFPPTYKYVHGSTTLDTKRSPAYTDRILHLIPPSSTVYSPPVSITSQEYTSHQVLWSDHRPVSSTCEVGVRVVDEKRRAEELARVESELDRLEEVYRPSVVVGGEGVDFGQIKVGREGVREITMNNQGRVDASWSLRPPSTGKPICKSYYNPFPCCGTLAPGMQGMIKVVCCVGEEACEGLTSGRADMNDVLVLQVNGGKDTFIPLQATFLPTILGLPLAALAALNAPIRDLSMSQRKALLRATGERVAANGRPAEQGAKTTDEAVDTTASDAAAVGKTADLVQTAADHLEETADAIKEAASDVKAGILGVVVGSAKGERDNGKERTADGSIPQVAEVERESKTGGLTPQQATAARRGQKAVREVWRLLEYLMDISAGSSKGLWVGEGEDDDQSGQERAAVMTVIDALDTAEPLPRGMDVPVSLALLLILACVPDGLVPEEKWGDAEMVEGRDDAFGILEGLEGVRTNVSSFLVQCSKEVLIGLMSVVKLCSASAFAGAESGQLPEEVVDALVPALFAGQGVGIREGRRRFVRMLFEG